MVPILPILGAISTVATTAWDTYNRIKQVRESAATKKGDRLAQDALLARMEQLENACLDQAQVLSELSKELDQFARAMTARYAVLRRVVWAGIGVSVCCVAALLYLLVK
jgi:hypothetical protein